MGSTNGLFASAADSWELTLIVADEPAPISGTPVLRAFRQALANRVNPTALGPGQSFYTDQPVLTTEVNDHG